MICQMEAAEPKFQDIYSPIKQVQLRSTTGHLGILESPYESVFSHLACP